MSPAHRETSIAQQRNATHRTAVQCMRRSVYRASSLCSLISSNRSGSDQPTELTSYLAPENTFHRPLKTKQKHESLATETKQDKAGPVNDIDFKINRWAMGDGEW